MFFEPDRSTSVYIFFLALKGRPRATPWVKINQYLSPVRAQHKDKLKRTHSKNVTPLQGLNFLYIYPGRCPGLLCCRPFRAKKKNVYTYRPIRFEPAAFFGIPINSQLTILVYTFFYNNQIQKFLQ
jgi:hypothetical protein